MLSDTIILLLHTNQFNSKGKKKHSYSRIPTHAYLLTHTYSRIPTHAFLLTHTYSPIPTHPFLLTHSYSPIPTHAYHNIQGLYIVVF